MPKFLKFLIGLGVVAVVCVVVAWVFGAQLLAKMLTRNTARQYPVVLVVPKPLADVSINSAKGTAGVFGDYSFEVPWAAPPPPKVQSYGSGGSTYDFGGHVVTVYTRPPNEIMGSLRKNPQQQQYVDNLFEGDTPKTDYEYVRRVLNVTPDTFTWSISKLETMRDGVLLASKANTTPHEGASGIFYVTTPEFHGFQYGVPEAKQTGVSVDLYNKKVLLKFTFRERGGAPAVISQQDINRIVQSLHSESSAPTNDN
jgi:hypothetical protein